MEAVGEGTMTIDELARAAGTTTRNVRAYQTRGLLPPPRLVGRVGHYDAGHIARLRLISKLQDQGFSLAAIDRLLAAWHTRRSLSDLLGFEEALTEPWSVQGSERLSARDLEVAYRELADDPSLVERAASLGLLVRNGDGYLVPHPELLRIGTELVSLGIPVERALDEFEALREQTGAIAQRFVELFERFVWDPFVDDGMPADRLPDVTEKLRRLRPLAARGVAGVLGVAMDEAVAEATASHLSPLVEQAKPAS
jgi:DNA-binding transcriptional MerR regulator